MSKLTYPCYHVYKDNKSEWRWTYYAKNAKIIAVSSESYKAAADCEHAVNLMKASSNDPLIKDE